ncbi:hypothetical protein CIPAW_05G181700 [Carya illinoinensis]|uniref:Plant intracellular Ras-group-related LRR protein 3 n=1 Tax=Carya illinoinensis TaxID=32201 RepID=A0A8T1QKM9_CARIL|nr:hypothetical protein CIPAW_05G181700 [Carya illinoinensis]
MSAHSFLKNLLVSLLTIFPSHAPHSGSHLHLFGRISSPFHCFLISMDPNPTDFPILSHVLFLLNPTSHSPPQLQEPLLTQMPYLNHPKVLTALAQAIPDICKQKQSKLQKNLQENETHATVKGVVDRVQNENDLGEVAEADMHICKAAVRLEDMHEEYERQLRGVEDRLVKVYGSVVAELEEQELISEEVIGILKEADSGVVERVELCGRQLRFLPEAFGKLHGLIVLNLSHNLLEVLPDSIARLQKLEELDVSSNLLVSLPDSIGLLLNLKVLNISGNKINSLPETISRCSSLVELDASFNNLMCLPTNIGYGVANIERLSIQLNKIRFLPASICEMSGNFSDLTELPETIGDLMNLRELDLSNNQIRVLPDSFSELKNLRKLNLDQNPLIIPPVEIVNKGVEAVLEFMAKRLLDIRAGEQRRNMLEMDKQQAQTGWLAWGASLLNNFVSGVSQSFAGHAGDGKTSRDPWLDQQL